jgi:outer membrane lipoprotein-sorting protein
VSNFLRTTSTRRLLGLIAALIAVIGGGTAIAVAASGAGPVPAPRPLAQAIHSALAAPAPAGITARIKFTNNLIPSSNMQGSDPLLTGASGRVWLSDRGLRLELQSTNGDAQVVVNAARFWVYDPSSNTVYEGKLPARVGKEHASSDKQHQLPSIAQIQSDLSRLIGHVNISGAIPSDVAGQAAYTVRVSPRHDGGLLGAAELAWDASRGIPLRIAVYARNDSSPVLELKATDISYARVPTSVFAISPPIGAKVVKVDTSAARGLANGHQSVRRERGRHVQISGVAAVARHLRFPLVAPNSLVGLPRRSVTLLDWGGSPAALISYGQNLGGIAVIEQTASSGRSAPPSASSGDHAGLSLPTVSIKGSTGQELDTALGTMIRFTRGQVSYTVVGSVPATAAELAARAL